MSNTKRNFLALMTALVAGMICHQVLFSSQSTGDFYASLRMARDLLQGADPYAHPVGDDLVSYPLPAAFLALPFSFFPDPLASTLFAGLSAGLLAWLLMGKGETWPILMLFSWPFIYALFFAQWTPLIVCLWFVPGLIPLVLMKPQSALPLLLTRRKFSLVGIGVSALALIVSLVIYPVWPFVWLDQITGYKGSLPPLFSLPLGPILLLALLRWRDERSWLILTMAIMPQRVVYDQLALLLVASNRRELIFQVVVSWLTLPALFIFDGWVNFLGGWQNWIVATLYIPALLLLFYKDVLKIFRKLSPSRPQ